MKDLPARTHRRKPPLMVLLGVVLILSACTMKPALFKIEGLDHPVAAGTIVDSRSGQPITFDQLVQQLVQVPVVYVGEHHTDRTHHQVQLRIIRALVDQGADIRVGMEMFDHTYQAVLDQWSAGDLNWEAFLKKSHWYANWRFDDTLYKDILAFIQERHLKLIGLNIPFCIPPKIAVGGLENLSEHDRAQLPERIDTTQPEHRAYVEEIFKMHQMKGRDTFKNFYTAQCAWEDSMARAVADNLNQAAMVVLVGNGHIVRKFGIPDRAFRQSQAPFRTVYLATPRMSVSAADGDFIWITPAEGGSPRMNGPH